MWMPMWIATGDEQHCRVVPNDQSLMTAFYVLLTTMQLPRWKMWRRQHSQNEILKTIKQLTILCNTRPFGVGKLVLSVTNSLLHARRKRRTMSAVERRITTQSTVRKTATTTFSTEMDEPATSTQMKKIISLVQLFDKSQHWKLCDDRACRFSKAWLTKNMLVGQYYVTDWLVKQQSVPITRDKRILDSILSHKQPTATKRWWQNGTTWQKLLVRYHTYHTAVVVTLDFFRLLIIVSFLI